MSDKNKLADIQDQLAKTKAELNATKKLLIEVTGKLEKSKKLGLIDDLTGCFNQNYYNKWVNDSFDPERDDGRLGLVFFDMNGLKKLNDKYGHEAGDKALIDFAKFLRKKLRKSDVIIRNGGDEFMAICLAANNDNKFESGLQSRVDNIMSNCPVSVAYGVAIFRSEIDDNNIDSTKTRADKQMYEHKKETKILPIYRKIGAVYKKVAGK